MTQFDAELKEREAVKHVTENLAAEYGGAHPPEEVKEVVEEKREHYADARIRDFIPVLVEREAREELSSG